MSMLSRNVTFRFRGSDLKITRGMLENITGLRSHGYRPNIAEFNFREDEQLANREKTRIE